ncbi:MAG: hypothetical protein R2856_03025 [Caldilineaceae bacterium]
MQIYTYSEARQKLVSLLDQALTEGDVLIRRRNGTLFLLRPEEMTSYPLDVAAWTSILASMRCCPSSTKRAISATPRSKISQTP